MSDDAAGGDSTGGASWGGDSPPPFGPVGFDILLEEGPCLVVAKPGGLLTQAPPEIDSLETRIKRFLKFRDERPGNIYLGMPHRLDRPVSGALVVTRHVRAAQRVSKQFEQRRVTKLYWALVEGELADEQGTWTDQVRKIPRVARAEIVDAEHPEGRSAVLHYRVRGRAAGLTWLELELETGRMHQIRVQCAHHGCPVLGDEFYGATRPFGPVSEEFRDRWIALHARVLAFQHPMTKTPVRVEAPLASWWDEHREWMG